MILKIKIKRGEGEDKDKGGTEKTPAFEDKLVAVAQLLDTPEILSLSSLLFSSLSLSSSSLS